MKVVGKIKRMLTGSMGALTESRGPAMIASSSSKIMRLDEEALLA